MTLELVAVDVGGAPDAWAAAGFAAAPDRSFRVGGVTFRVHDTPVGITRCSVRGVAPDGADLDGLPLDRSPNGDPPDSDGVACEHPNGAVLLDHLVIATPDCDRTIAAFRAEGCEPRRERIAGTAEHPIRQTFLRAGEVILEVVGPTEPPARADHRARPATFWGLAFTTRDIDACAAVLADRLGPVRDAVQPGRRIASLRHEAVGLAIPIAFMSEPPRR